MKALFTGILIVLLTSTAHAACGPTFKLNGETTSDYGDRAGKGKIGFTLTMPLNDIDCRKEEAAISKSKEQEREVAIRNLDKISRICKANADNPAFAQLCHVELPNLLDEVIR